MKQTPVETEGFRDALAAHAAHFKIELGAGQMERLGDYYKMVMAWNPRLHLVAPCTPEGFAVRHVLESLTALPFIPKGARILDIGSGAGLPLIPCLAVRDDLRATLVEASSKKAIFLNEALHTIHAKERARVISRRFEEIQAPEADVVTCRALERFTEKLEELARWSPPESTLLFFGGPALQEAIERASFDYQALLIPESERRFLFIIHRA